MTGKEIITANLEHNNPERVGLTFDEGRINDIEVVSPAAPLSYTPKRWVDGGKEYYDDQWGNIWRRMLAGCVKGEIYKEALDDWSKLEQLQAPDYSDIRQYLPVKAAFDKANDKFKLLSLDGWIFDNARYIRRLDVYLMDMVENPDNLKKLHKIVASVYESKIVGAAVTGADGILIGEDMGTQTGLLFSPVMWDYYFKALYTELFSLAHSFGLKVFMHSCGKNWDILDNLIEAGVDCLQFDQPLVYDIERLARKLREKKVGLWSPIDIQKVLPTGDKDYIQEQTSKMIEIFKGGLILKNYPDLNGIGVDRQWDMWAYTKACELNGIDIENS